MGQQVSCSTGFNKSSSCEFPVPMPRSLSWHTGLFGTMLTNPGHFPALWYPEAAPKVICCPRARATGFSYMSHLGDQRLHHMQRWMCCKEGPGRHKMLWQREAVPGEHPAQPNRGVVICPAVQNSNLEVSPMAGDSVSTYGTPSLGGEERSVLNILDGHWLSFLHLWT